MLLFQVKSLLNHNLDMSDGVIKGCTECNAFNPSILKGAVVLPQSVQQGFPWIMASKLQSVSNVEMKGICTTLGTHANPCSRDVRYVSTVVTQKA